MIYLDSSALLKLLVEEPESAALATWLSHRSDDPPVSSELAKFEVVRAARRLDERVVTSARSLMSQLFVADDLRLISRREPEGLEVSRPGVAVSWPSRATPPP